MGLTMYFNGTKVKAWYHNGDLIHTSGNIVTYHIDTTSIYEEEVDSDATCLAPKTFTPAKEGWIFVGWREDTTASGDVLTEKAMADEPITLYAVFKKDVTVTYYDGNSTAKSKKESGYYNNTNVVDAAFTLVQTAQTGWTVRGWSTGTTGNAAITYNNATEFTLDKDITLYGMYQQTLTLSYNGNGSTSGSTAAQTGVRYWNSGNDAYINPSFALRTNGFGKTEHAFTKWAMGSASGTQYAAGASVTLSANTVFYAIWQDTKNRIIINDVLQSGITRSIIDTNPDLPNGVTYPSTTSCVIFAEDAEDEEESGWCTMRYNKVIQGNGKKIYVQSDVYCDNYNEPGPPTTASFTVWKVQLVNISTGAITTLGQYNSTNDENSIIDGVVGNTYNAVNNNNKLIGYTLPSSGNYYFQIRYFVYEYGGGGRYVTCKVHNCYAMV